MLPVFLLFLSLGCGYLDPDSDLNVEQAFVTIFQRPIDDFLPYHPFVRI